MKRVHIPKLQIMQLAGEQYKIQQGEKEPVVQDVEGMMLMVIETLGLNYYRIVPGAIVPLHIPNEEGLKYKKAIVVYTKRKENE